MDLVIGLIVGILGSIIASAIAPAIFDKIAVSMALRFFRTNASFHGDWTCKWTVKSSRYDAEMIDSAATIRQFMNWIKIEFYAHSSIYVAEGKIESGKYVTGVWRESTTSGYHGAFQMIIDPETKNLSGMWIGYSTSGIVKNGSITLNKN